MPYCPFVYYIRSPVIMLDPYISEILVPRRWHGRHSTSQDTRRKFVERIDSENDERLKMIVLLRI